MNRGASVAIAETAVSDRFRGGKRATQGGALCTTTFGVWKSGVGGGYLTAGPCGTGTWTVNGNTSTSVQDRQISTYDDREVIVAPGASWWVQITLSGTEVDMEASAGHIYLNGSYCHFGQLGDLACGTITAVNVPVPGPPTTYATQSTARCRPGDSGGPVWRLSGNTRYPSGLIIHGDESVPPIDGEYPCRYVALDDQLEGLAWVLY